MACRSKLFERRALVAAAAILGGASVSPIPAAAQSAERTVAFMLWGLEEDPKIQRVAENLWEAEGYDGDRSRFHILRLTDCRFHVSSQVQRAGMLDVLEVDYVLDFGAVHEYSAWFANDSDQRIIVKIEGQSWYNKTVRSKTTGRVLQKITGGNVDAYVANGGSPERLRRTFVNFSSAFCHGRGQ
jgi:hypothetical protein